MSMIEKLKADFLPRTKELENDKFKLGDDEITVYYSTVANAVQSDKYMPLMVENKIQGYVELLIVRAKNQDGSPMFAPKDKTDLMKNVDPSLIVDIGNKILGADADYAPEAAQESENIAKK